MVHIKQKLLVWLIWFTKQPKKYTLSLATIFFFGIILYIFSYIPIQPVILSYAEKTCVTQLVLFPGIHKTAQSSDFNVTHTREAKIGSLSLVAGDVCFTPIAAPQPGMSMVEFSPLRLPVARYSFSLTVPPPVAVDQRALSAPISTSKPLKVGLSDADVIFTYSLHVNDQKTDCKVQRSTLICDIASLRLGQSRQYHATINRQFAGKHVAKVFHKEVNTITAATVVDASIKPGEVIYDKTKSFKFTFDKPVVSAVVKLYQVDGDEQRSLIVSTSEITDKDVTITLKDDLLRKKNFAIHIERVEAADGSGLEGPVVTPFETSGGPRVSTINVATYGVPMGSTVVVTFDQPLSETQDNKRFITLSGGIALTGQRANQLFFSVAGVSKCGDFSIQLTNDIESNYDIGGQSSWRYAGRTVCHSVGAYGTSTQGRPLNAYYFGSGTTTVVYTGAIHGNEVSTKLLMDRWVQELEANARSIPANVSVVVIPTINPDGFARGSRVNARNVDLNRNFGTSDWQRDITTTSNQPFAGGGGEAAMSEIETQALAALIQRLRPKVVLSYHSIGGVVAANQAGSSASWATTYARLSGYRNITGQSSDTFEYAISGTADDYYAERLGVPSLLIELGSHSNPQFSVNQAAMWAMLRE